MFSTARVLCASKFFIANVRRTCATSAKLSIEPNIKFPKSDKKFARYLNSLVERGIHGAGDRTFLLKTIAGNYEHRTSLVSQLIELQEAMANESDEEMLKMGAEEMTVSLRCAIRALQPRSMY